MKNKRINNKENTKQFKIVAKKYRGKTIKYISNRIIRYNTLLGNNSVGNEVGYNNLDDAIENEMFWLKK